MFSPKCLIKVNRKPAAMTALCLNIKQDYAGGGRFNAEVYRSSVSEEVFGCP
jgi:hypothetical protein